MRDRLHRINGTALAGVGLAVAALTGWGAFAYSAVSANRQIAALTSERDASAGQLQQLQDSAGSLAQIDAKLGSARMEYAKVVQGWAEIRGKMGSAQQELAVLTKRLDQAKERVTQTGSLRPSEPPKRPAR